MKFDLIKFIALALVMIESLKVDGQTNNLYDTTFTDNSIEVSTLLINKNNKIVFSVSLKNNSSETLFIDTTSLDVDGYSKNKSIVDSIKNVYVNFSTGKSIDHEQQTKICPFYPGQTMYLSNQINDYLQSEAYQFYFTYYGKEVFFKKYADTHECFQANLFQLSVMQSKFIISPLILMKRN